VTFSFSLYSLKNWFQRKLGGLVSFLCFLNVSANHVTFFSVLISAFTGFFIFFISNKEEMRVYFLIVPVLFFVRIILNILDGLIAKKRKINSGFGMILNEVSDVVSDALVFLPFLFVKELNVVFLVLFVFFSFLSEFAGAVAFMVCKKRSVAGPMGKPDRLFVFGLISISIAVGFWVEKLNDVLILTNTLLLLTIYNRLQSALRANG